ncbi:hypothetical protein [Ralstonia soli]|uniref:Transmembrane protein n=1 Tax=Ralstonia soli TaxID=2953896 RepID=A0ABT1AEE9_9RALS|nr:hypothetical protein [Ralstonia soli]MCO5396746.1 hypothetical protein [Ralstonia soli]
MNDQGGGSSAKCWVCRKEARPQELITAAINPFVARVYMTIVITILIAIGVLKH